MSIDIIGYIVQGIFIAIGSVIGNYISNKGLIAQFEKLVKKVKREQK